MADIMLVQNRSALSGEVDGRHVLFNLEDRQLHQLNDTGAATWSILQTPHRVGDVVEELSRRYGVRTEDVRADVLALVESLREEGLCLPIDCMEQDRSSAVHANARTGGQERRNIHHTIGPFRALTLGVVLDVDDESVRHELDRLLDPLRGSPPLSSDQEQIEIQVQSAGAAEWSVQVGNGPTRTLRTRRALIRHVVAEVNGSPLPYLDSAIVFHAAAAEIGSGIVMFPGVSNAGKSTLVTQLVHRGHGYVTDEATLIDTTTQMVSPFTKAISLDPGSHEALSEILSPMSAPGLGQGYAIDVDPRSVGPGRLSDGGRVQAIVFPTFTPGAATERTALDPFDSFSQLLACAFNFDGAGREAFDTIVNLANEVPAYNLVHSGGPEHLAMIEELF